MFVLFDRVARPLCMIFYPAPGGRAARQPSLRTKKQVSQFGLPHPVEPQPSWGESISFLSPARAAGAPTFCDATESRQRTQPRDLRPLGHPPPVLPSLAKPSCGPTPAELCKEKPNLRVPSGTAKDGRCCASRQAHPKARPRSPYEGRRHHPYGPDCCSKTAISDRAPLRRPPRRAQLRCCSAGYGAVSEKQPRPTVAVRAPREIIPDKR